MSIDIKLVKIGNSLTIRIPKLVATQLHLEAGTRADLFFDSTHFSVRPKQIKKTGYNLDTMLKKITPENCHAEQFNDLPLGAEFV